MLTFTARDYNGHDRTIKVRGRLVHDDNGADATVSLVQVRKGAFVVVYGLQVSRVLDRRLAAIEYGNCLMHSLECAGKLD